MPLYDYQCAECGPFSEIRPMAESGLPLDCPGCGASAPRALLGAPGLATMSGTARAAMATNERSAHAPKRASGHSHGAGCGCAAHGKAAGASGVRGAPGRRPWMLSH